MSGAWNDMERKKYFLIPTFHSRFNINTFSVGYDIALIRLPSKCLNHVKSPSHSFKRVSKVFFLHWGKSGNFTHSTWRCGICPLSFAISVLKLPCLTIVSIIYRVLFFILTNRRWLPTNLRQLHRSEKNHQKIIVIRQINGSGKIDLFKWLESILASISFFNYQKITAHRLIFRFKLIFFSASIFWEMAKYHYSITLHLQHQIKKFFSRTYVCNQK